MSRHSVAHNVARVLGAVAEACARAGRRPESVTLIAVVKRVSPDQVREVVASGVGHLAENRVADLVDKYNMVGDRVAWHMIGRLQTNKVRRLLSSLPLALIHSLDRLSLAETLEAEAGRLGIVQPILVQVNVSGEESKGGVSSEELVGFVRGVADLKHLRVCGLMGMAPPVGRPEEARPFFRLLRDLREDVKAAGIRGVSMEHLSMGMSGDYQIAVEEGATLIRVGQAIFGEV